MIGVGIYAVCAGAGAATALAGLVWAGIGWYGTGPGEVSAWHGRAHRLRAAGQQMIARRRLVQAGIAVVAGLVVWLVSGWPVAGLIVAAGTVVVPALMAAPRQAASRIDRLEALEEWTRRLADVIAAGGAPVQTIIVSAETAPAPLRAELRQLATRLRTPRLDKTQSLRVFADALDDPLGDVVVIALEAALSPRASDRIPGVLRATSAAVAAEVRARREVEAERAGPRKESTLILAFAGLTVAWVVLFTSWVAEYRGVAGQLVLAIIGGVALGAMALMRRYTLAGRPPRILTDTDGGAQ